MRKLILLFSLLGLLISSYGQLQVPAVASSIQTGTAYSAEYQTVYDAMTTPPDATNAGYQNTMVSDLVDGGYWTNRMDIFYCFAQSTNNNGEAFLNWTDPTGDDNVTDGNSTTFTAYEGFTGNIAGADYLVSNWTASTEAVNSSLNSTTIAVYLRLDIAGTTSYDFGTGTGDRTSFASKYDVSNNLFWWINESAGNSYASSVNQYFWIVTRRGANETEIYRNGTSYRTGTAVSTNLPSSSLNFLARGTANFSPNQIAIAFVMDAVSDAEATAINTIIEAYMDAIGKGVQ